MKATEPVGKASLCGVWGHYESGCLDEALCVAAPAPWSAGEIEEEVDENVRQTIRSRRSKQPKLTRIAGRRKAWQ